MLTPPPLRLHTMRGETLDAAYEHLQEALYNGGEQRVSTAFGAVGYSHLELFAQREYEHQQLIPVADLNALGAERYQGGWTGKQVPKFATEYIYDPRCWELVLMGTLVKRAGPFPSGQMLALKAPELAPTRAKLVASLYGLRGGKRREAVAALQAVIDLCPDNRSPYDVALTFWRSNYGQLR